jgi:hypothetical protein
MSSWNRILGKLAVLPALVLTLAGNARGECIVHGQEVSLDGLLVKAARDHFHLDTWSVAMSAKVPLSDRGWFQLAISDLLSFKAQRRAVSLYVQRPISTPALQVAPWVEIIGAHEAGKEVIGSLVLENSAGLDCRSAPDVVLTPVRLPCDALRLPDSTYHDLDSSPPELPGEPPPAWLIREGLQQIRLRSSPKWNAPAVMVQTLTKGSELALSFQEIARQGDWIQVRGWGRGTYFSGWLRHSDLRSIPPLEVYSRGGLSGSCDAALTDPRSVGVGVPGDARPTYRGKAKIAAGATVYREGPWATVTRSIELEVRYELGSKRVYLLGTPGLSGDELYASVPVEFVELPSPLPVGR